MAQSTNAGQKWIAPDFGGKALEQAVNWVKGLHPDALSKSLTVEASGPASRLLLLGEQRIPNGVSLRIAGVCRIL